MKFLVKFTKQGNMKYISHLDIMRLFQRSLKRTHIKLQYSEGYSPHPKMSIAQPLSLGFTSTGEYIEFETQQDFLPEDVKERLNNAMPEGIKMVSCTVLENTRKAMGALITNAGYLIGADEPETADEIKALGEAVAAFRKEKSITVEKVQKKTGKVTEVDIRKKTAKIELIKANSGHAVIRVLVDAGSSSNLNPELIIAKLKEYMGKSLHTLNFHVEREEMFTRSEDGTLIPLYLLR